MDEFKIAYESYFSNHPGAVESLRKDRQKPSTIKLDMIRASWAKPLIRMEAFPLKLRDLEKYQFYTRKGSQVLYIYYFKVLSRRG